MMYKLLLISLFTLLMLIPDSISAQRKWVKKEIAIQLYSVRDEIGSFVTRKYDKDYIPTLEKLAKMGYTAVEAACYVGDGKFYGRTPEKFKKDVESVGLKTLSSHCAKPLQTQELETGNFTESLKWWKECVAAHKTAGMAYIVTPTIGKPTTVKDLKTYCDYLNAVGKMCKESGLKYGYHNHSHEFLKVEGQVKMMDFLLENTNPEYVFFEMDVYWVVLAKESPVAYFKKYPGRFKLLHIKDQREIGQSGMVGFDAIFRNAETAGVEYPIVELEEATNNVDEGVKISIDYLLDAPFVKASYKR